MRHGNEGGRVARRTLAGGSQESVTAKLYSAVGSFCDCVADRLPNCLPKLSVGNIVEPLQQVPASIKQPS
jgi:hypothetical protein